MKRKLKIFLSSTFRDLTTERFHVIRAIVRMEEVAVAMESFGSLPEEPLEECLKKVRQADVFVLILGDVYGFVPPDGRVSITESEYLEARKAEVPVLVYMKEPASRSEKTRASGKRKTSADTDPRLAQLKQRLMESHVVSWYSNEDNLATQVAADLYRESKQVFSDPVRDEEDPELAARHMKVVRALLSHDFGTALALADEILRHHSGKSPRAKYNKACALSMLAEQESEPAKAASLLAGAAKAFEESLSQGIVRLIRIHSPDSDPHTLIRDNRGLKLLFEKKPQLLEVLSISHDGFSVSFGPGCVDANTLVSMADGTDKCCSKVRIGDEVVVWREGMSEMSTGRVVGRRQYLASQVVRINGQLTTTGNHPILTRDGWTPAKDVKRGELLRVK